MQRNPHSYQIATGYRTFYSLSLIYQPITKKRLFYYNKFFIGINYDGSASNAIYAHHPSDFAGISLANNKQLDDKTFQLAPYYYIEVLQGGFDYTGEGGSILITLP